ncbi:MAG: TIM barrel protein [Oscillospiraceae bacterium]|nr:TIM barrel protein [Oscillospiraceae bacterium]
MKLAYTVWTWMLEEYAPDAPTSMGKPHFEEAVQSISYLGYRYIENFNFIVPMYENDPQELLDLLKKNRLELVNLYHTYYYDGTQETLDKWLDLGERTCKILQLCGAKYINLQGNIWQDEPFYRPDNHPLIDAYVDAFMKMGAIAKKYDIQACMHPHAGTAMFSESQIDYFIEKCDMDLVHLTLDTAHITLAGMDACYAFDKYAKYIDYVHFKDLDPDENNWERRPVERFCAPGQGFIDFKNILKVLRKNGYDGVICIENDRPRICSYESAETAIRYAHSTLDLY